MYLPIIFYLPHLENFYYGWQNDNRILFWIIKHIVLHYIDHACSNKLLIVLIRDKLTNQQTKIAESADPLDTDLAKRACTPPIWLDIQL